MALVASIYRVLGAAVNYCRVTVGRVDSRAETTGGGRTSLRAELESPGAMLVLAKHSEHANGPSEGAEQRERLLARLHQRPYLPVRHQTRAAIHEALLLVPFAFLC